MVKNPIVGPKLRHFSMHRIMKLLQYSHIISLVDCFASWNEFKVNNTIDINESDEHCLCDLACELSWVMGMPAVSIANFVVHFQDHIESTAQVLLAFFLNFRQNLMLIHCSKN